MNGLFSWELFCLRLSLQSQTADSEYMVLPHCALGALPDIRDETFEIHQRLITRVVGPGAAAFTTKTWSVPVRPARSTYFRNSIMPSVPTITSRPSPQVDN